MDAEGPRPTPPDSNSPPRPPIDAPASASVEGRGSPPPRHGRYGEARRSLGEDGTPAPDNAPPSPAPASSPPRPNPWRRPVELIAFVAWLILVIVLISIRPESPRIRDANSSTARATISTLETALYTYRADHSTYPFREGSPLVGDSTFFIQCLRTKSPRGVPYYQFRDGEIVEGELRSWFDKPFRYTCPARGLPGPDGIVHDGVEFYLWTWGYTDTNGPPSEWGVNNWSQ